MRHRKAGRKLDRTTSHRKALWRNLTTSLFLHEQIRTTPAKAKEARRLAEKTITLAKEGSLASRRRALAILGSKEAVEKLFDEIAPRYAERNGGYTRILHLDGPRLGDNAPQVIFELVKETDERKKPSKGRARKEPAAKEKAKPAAPKQQKTKNKQAGPEKAADMKQDEAKKKEK